MNQKPGTIWFILGKAGAGKNECIKRLLADASLGLHQILSVKTRDLRPGEKNGVDFYHMTNSEFEQEITKGNFVERIREDQISPVTNEITGKYTYYGTHIHHVRDALQGGGNSIKELEYRGFEQLLQSSMKAHIAALYIDVSTDSAIQRMDARSTISDDDRHRRIDKMKKEQARIESNPPQVYRIANDYHGTTPEEVASIINTLTIHMKEIILQHQK